MNLRLAILSLPLPGAVRARALRELWQATAAGFGTALPDSILPEPLLPEPPLPGPAPSESTPPYPALSVGTPRPLRYRQLLEGYARFTREAAVRALERGENIPALQARLREQARSLGARMRRRLRLRSRVQAMAAARALYNFINIDFQADPDGEILVHRCFFRHYYSGPVCRLISALDEGLLAGLSGAVDGQGTLRFRERLTEGAECCRADFQLEGAISS
jgi:hypothetical protein